MHQPEVSNPLSQTQVPPTYYLVDHLEGPINRIPSFYKSNPELWFQQIEAIFSTSRITSAQKKFQLAISRLEQDVLTQTADLFSLDAQDQYILLKERLMSIYGYSENRRLEKLLEENRLGSQKPSQLYREMMQVAGSTVPRDFVQKLWMRNLPVRVQQILLASRQDDVQTLIRTADMIMEVDGQPEIFTAGQQQTQSPPPIQSDPSNDPLYKGILEELRDLRLEVAELREQHDRARSSRTYSPRFKTRVRTTGLCYYHRKFKEEARKCTQPCSWSLNK